MSYFDFKQRIVDSGRDDVLTPNGMFRFVQGILNGTTIISTSSSASCESAMSYQRSSLN